MLNIESRKKNNMSTDTNTLGRFGHHPDPAIDFCIEVDAIKGELRQLALRLHVEGGDLGRRINRAMDFRVGGDPNACLAKVRLRQIEDEYHDSILPSLKEGDRAPTH